MVAVVSLLSAATPPWWAQHGIITSDTVHDYGLINQGQLKKLVKGAYLEMEEHLPGGAGAAITALIANFDQPGSDDYATVNIGQLKNLAKPFFDRLTEVGYIDPPIILGKTYPWTTEPNTPQNDFGFANIGQAKQLFSFDLTALGMPGDADGDGTSDLDEVQANTDPLDPAPVITLSGPAGATLQ